MGTGTTRATAERMPERSLAGWLSYLENLHPRAIDLGLERCAEVARRLALVPCARPVIIVAGTNGKGSVVHACDALLSAHGLRCGRYTSPHLRQFNERIVVAGRAAGDDAIVRAFAAVEAARGEVSLTYFEFATLAALLLFREAAPDVLILEVGLGGRLDAVNIVDADIAVITAIDLDHQQWLGDDRETIGREKAAVARPGRPVVLAESDYPASVGASLAAAGARVQQAGVQWHWHCAGSPPSLSLQLPAGPSLRVPVPAGLRAGNIAAALCAASLQLGERFDAARALAALDGLSIPGRRQSLQHAGRELLLDVAHNPGAMRALAAALAAPGPRRRTFAALGVMADKDLPAMATALAAAVDGACALALPGIDRAQAAEAVWRALDSAGVAVAQSEFTVDAVWRQLLAGSAPGDRIVFCGSFHSVAAILNHLDIAAGLPPGVDGGSGG